MRRELTVLVASAMLLGSALVCQAMPGPGEPPCSGCEEPPFPASLTRILEVGEAQKGQIQSILDEGRKKVQAQHQKESELRRKLHSAERADSFDEQAVRSVAAALAGLETERIVSHARTHYRINTVLSSSQRSLAESLWAERDEMPPPCGCQVQRRGREGAEQKSGH
jgi:Spy/CpxP family protein refolding chaperone